MHEAVVGVVGVVDAACCCDTDKNFIGSAVNAAVLSISLSRKFRCYSLYNYSRIIFGCLLSFTYNAVEVETGAGDTKITEMLNKWL